MRRSFPTLALTAALALAGAGAVAPSYASQSGSSGSTTGGTGHTAARTAATSVRLEGRGYGHGHGMSQYGAQGAARQGRSYRQIIAFYYPHTAWGTAAGSVSVQISENTSNDVVVGARTGLTLHSLVTKRTWHLAHSGARRWRIVPADKGADSQLQVLVNSWQKVRTVKGPAEFGAGGAPVRLYFKGGSRTYHGTLRSAGGTKRDTVNVLSLETYLHGVVPQEMPASWDPAAVRSQAVAARTYAAYERSHPISKHYQICDTASCQVYGGASAEAAASNAAVKATAHQVRLSGGKPAFAQFSASNGGWTAAGGFPYLPAKKDPYDPWSGNPYRDWHVTIRATAIDKAYPSIGAFQRLAFVKRDGHGSWG
ncbi:MAG: SpoIID/LytB domain-containing protein, partial [Nocardioidaceae bacterium]|nr:SpoIID/LytB domain-containing protein [Nocardioidaceae bacterium]